MTNLTHVDLLWIEKRIERWIRFGQIEREEIIDRSRRIVAFRPGAVFAFIRWRANDYGTIESRVDILRAVEDVRMYSTVPFVTPGGECLLRLSGWPKVATVLNIIDAIEANDIDPRAVCPDHWRHVMNRLSVNDLPRPYTHERHNAWLKRRQVSAA